MAASKTYATTIALLIVSILFSYRMGVTVRCTSQLVLSPSSMHKNNINVELPTSSHPDRSSSLLSSRNNNALLATLNNNDNNTTSLPYQCGVVFFYHIPSTGGASINTWLNKYTPKKGGNVTYFTHWIPDYREKSGWLSNHQNPEKKFIHGMNKLVTDIPPTQWRIAHAHINSLHLNESEHLLTSWRSTVEAQGCTLLNNVVFRDALSHTLSLYKVVDRKQSTQDEWAQHLATPSDRGLWSTQLDFFLYNRGRRNPFGVSKEEKVRRAISLLDRHFDLVVVSDHARYMESLLKITGWEYVAMKKRNEYTKELQFTKKEVELLMKRLGENGDVDFIDALRMKYQNYMNYFNV